MITVREYSTISLAQKADYLYDKGIFLGYRITQKYLKELYALENFFVEIQLSNEETCNDHIIIKIEALNDTNALFPYLKKISLQDLYQF